jgi:hypothetical protein
MLQNSSKKQKASKASQAYFATLPYKALSGLPDKQIEFLLTGTRIANDVLLIQRLLIAIENSRESTDSAELQAGTFSWFTSITLLAGKLWEGFDAVRRYSEIGKSNSSIKLCDEGTAARKALNECFANGSSLFRIRNKAAFHYDNDEVLEAEVKAFRGLTCGDESMKWVLGNELGNTIYLFSMASNAFAVLDAAYPSKARQAQMDALYDDVVRCSRNYVAIPPVCLHGGTRPKWNRSRRQDHLE